MHRVLPRGGRLPRLDRRAAAEDRLGRDDQPAVPARARPPRHPAARLDRDGDPRGGRRDRRGAPRDRDAVRDHPLHVRVPARLRGHQPRSDPDLQGALRDRGRALRSQPVDLHRPRRGRVRRGGRREALHARPQPAGRRPRRLAGARRARAARRGDPRGAGGRRRRARRSSRESGRSAPGRTTASSRCIRSPPGSASARRTSG